MRVGWNDYFLNIARVVATRSHDIETQVGSVIVDNNKRIISTGYNGFPKHVDDLSLPNTRPEKYKYMIHAELNALLYAQQNLLGATLYCTHSPCLECCKLIVATTIKKIVFGVQREDINEALTFLNRFGIECVILNF